MSGKLVNEQYLYDIADAIRRKNGESTLYRPQDMGTAILDIQTDLDILTLSFLEREITSYSNEVITKIRTYAFNDCYELTSIDIPEVTVIEANAIICSGLTSINVPKVTTIGLGGFSGCTSLPSIVLPCVTTIGNSAFSRCSSLTSITLSGSTVCTLGTNVFNDTPIASGTGYIYVPAELVDTYKAATNWSTYASQIVAIPSE